MTYVKDLATGTLASGIGTSDSSITVNVGYGTPEEILGVWPNVPFFITVLPGSPAAKISNSLDSEVMLVTAISENAGTVTMTVTRAQRGTTAKVFSADDIVANAVYAEDAVLIGPDGAVDNPSPWIEGNDIKAGVVNAATKTANNITPSADTPAAWATALGGDGYFWTYYSSNCFTNQPDQYGQLETLITGQQIYQRWHGHSDGNESYRGGNGTGWYGISGGAGTFRKSYDADEEFSTRGSTSIPANADLNTLTYVIPGRYDVSSSTTAATLSNCPTTTAFTMKVIDVNRPIVGSAAATTTWMNLVRVIYDINGAIWTQTVASNGSLVWSYHGWKMISSGDGDGAISISNVLDVAPGYTADEYYFYRQGKFLYLSISLHKNSGNFGGGERVATLKSPYYPAYATNYMCALAVGGLFATNAAGYLYISSVDGSITVGDSSAGCNYAKINIVYPLK